MPDAEWAAHVQDLDLQNIITAASAGASTTSR